MNKQEQSQPTPRRAKRTTPLTPAQIEEKRQIRLSYLKQNNQRYQAAKVAEREAAGYVPKKPSTPERKAEMKEYMRARRAAIKALKTPGVARVAKAKAGAGNRPAKRKGAVKDLSPSDLLKHRRILAIKREAKKVAALAIDARTKEGRTKEHWKAAKSVPKVVKPVKVVKPPLEVKPQPRKKLKQQADRIRIPAQDPTTTKTWIAELKMHVYLRPDQTIEQVAAKYSQRPGAKIGKL